MPKDENEKIPYSLLLWCLIIIGFATRLYMAHVDPFLHIWDERFHALVARNMMDFPLKPMLRIHPILPPDPFSWTQGSLWLHKPPLFMWQMALSMKLFGTTVYALRYPSVLMGTLMIPMVFYITKTVTKNKLIALITAGLFCFSNFHLELVGGMRSMDQNDLTLEFYVLASIWAWIKFEEKGKWYWLVLIGLFSGAAILTKWLIGLFVYLIWGMKLLLGIKYKFDIKERGKFLFSFFVCCLIFMPWQLYIIHYFPVESAYEYEFNRRHITEALEGHEGNAFFYLSRFPQLFGEGMFLLIFPGLYLWFKAKDKNKNVSIPLLLGTLFVFFFFSVIVKTKVISHVYFVAPFVMMLIAYTIVFIIERWLKRSYLIGIFLAGIFILNTKPEKIILDQSPKQVERNSNIYNAITYQRVGRIIPQGSVVVNVPDWVSFMFFNKGVVAYEHFSEEEIKLLQKRKVAIIAFDRVTGHPLPDYISSYPYLQVWHDTLR